MSADYTGTPPAQGLFDPSREHDACGVGFVVQMKGKRSHAIVENGLQILRNLEPVSYTHLTLPTKA